MKEIVLFGTGKYFDNYIKAHDDLENILFAVDNDEEKWGTRKLGLEIKSPKELRELPKESFYVVVCMAHYEEAFAQLDEMGITDVQFYKPIPMEETKIYTLVNGQLVPASDYFPQEKYKVGYVPGTFDVFHVGHLNLLRNAKKRCEYLIAGVLTDELYEHFKKKKPMIPFEQRAAIVEAIGYVDRVVPVSFENTVKIDAWNRLHYDCHFSGNDHGADWSKDVEQLREVGSNMEFFEYTKATSSTAIKEKL